MAIFSKQGYLQIAEVLRAAQRETEDCMDASVVIANVVGRLIDLFERDNQMFNRQRFYDSVGIESIPMREAQHGKTAG